MHVAGLSLDPYWFLQFVFTAFIVALGLLHLVKNTASKYFVVDANFDEGGVSVEGNRRTGRDEMLAVAGDGDGCAVCGNLASKKCARCKLVRYCSQTCQTEHWKSIHKSECKVAKSSGAISLVPSVSDARRRAVFGDKSPSDPGHGNCTVQLSKKILFPYDEFVKLFNWDKPGFPPCGLLNCGNSCFANVVLQCLSCTRPLVAYLFEKNHRRECRRNDWCFLCELQTHVERASHLQPFSPLNILSRLPNIGGNLGHGKQEDAHEFMRFAIDTMQSVCLDEFGGERALHPSSQETTLIQHTFGGQLQSQVICTKCNKISNRYENMMDLTVEIQGDASSLEDCLDQFTAREWLDGENMYKCDGCNDYVKAWKRLTVRQAPNILTIALKRFQSGRFGKLNKKVTFPEVLDLGPYMSELGDGTNLYSLYAVVVHVDMLNASYFGHYICYTKDFRGKWYRIDDCKVVAAELEEVLAQGAYMLLYSRNRVRPPCADSVESSEKQGRVVAEAQESVHCSQAPDESLNILDSHSSVVSNTNKIIPEELSLQVGADPKPTDGVPQELHLDDPHCFSSGLEDIECHSKESNQAVVTSVDLGHKELPDLSLSSDALSAMVQSKECESSSSYAVHETSFEDGSRATNNDSNDLTLESSTEISQSIENIVQEMAEISPEVCPAASSLAGEKLDEANHASYETSPSPCLEPAVAVKTCKCSPAAAQTADGAVSRLPEAKSPCKGNLKPMFSSGFLNKNARSKSLKRPAKTDSEHSDRSSRKDDWDCSGVTKPAFSGLSTDKICEPSELSSDSRSASTTCSVRQSEDCLHGDVDMKKEACGTWDPHNDNRCNGGVVSIISVENNRNNHHRDNGREEVYENGGGQLADNCLPVQQLESNPYYKEKLNLPSSGFLHSHRSLLVPEGEGENQPGEVSSSRIVEVQCNGLVEHAHDCQNNSEANGHGQLVLYSNGTSKSRFIGQAKHSVNTDKMVRKECADVGYPQNNCSRDSVHSDEQHGSRVYNNGSAQETFCGTSRSLVVDCRNPFHSTCDDISLGKNYSNKNEESQELNETIYHLEVETDCQRLSDGRPVTSCEMAKPPKKQPLNMTLVSPKSVRQRLDPKCDCKEYLNVTLAEGGQDFKRQRHV